MEHRERDEPDAEFFFPDIEQQRAGARFGFGFQRRDSHQTACPLKNIALILLLLGTLAAQGATNNAASCSFLDVTNAIAHSVYGDTVLLPAGTATWSNTVNMTGITLQGSGTNLTIIADGTAQFAYLATLQLNVIANYPTRVTGIQFTIFTNSYNNYKGMIAVYGQQPTWRIDNSFFNYTGAKSILVGDSSYGLIDHNYFAGNTKQYIEAFGTAYGDASWAAADTFGTTNTLVIEDNVFVDSNRFGSIDCDAGGRICVRHNTFTGTFFTVHGTESGLRYRGCRQLEVYNNSFYYPSFAPSDDFYTGCDIRGGAAMIFSNTFTGFNSSINLNQYRETDNDPNFAPWYGASGINGYDSNSVVLLSGTAAATSNRLYVAIAAWATNQFYGATVYNSNSVNGNKVFGMVISNDNRTMYFKTSRTAAYQFYITNGDPFSIHTAYPTIDQLGYGRSDLMTGAVPPAVWPNQQKSPCYFWSNTVATWTYASVYTTNDGAASSSYPNVLLNRDFFNTTNPAYTPLIYPHPSIGTNAAAAPTFSGGLLQPIGQNSTGVF
jgi:hypothetical protein